MKITDKYSTLRCAVLDKNGDLSVPENPPEAVEAMEIVYGGPISCHNSSDSLFDSEKEASNRFPKRHWRYRCLKSTSMYAIDGVVADTLDELLIILKERNARMFINEFGSVATHAHNRVTGYHGICQATPTPKGLRSKQGEWQPSKSGIWMPDPKFDELEIILRTKPEDPLSLLTTRPVNRSFVYFDVSEYSREAPEQQALIISGILDVIMREEHWQTEVGRHALAAVAEKFCIGDGYIFSFKDPVNAVHFAVRLAAFVELRVSYGDIPEMHFRMSVHTGKVFSFWDHGREGWNYAGAAINDGQRILSAFEGRTDDVVYLSAEMRKQILALHDNRELNGVINALTNRGSHKDKHGVRHRIYELNHMEAIPTYDLPRRILGGE